MAVQDKCGGAVLPGGNGVSLNSSLNFVNGTQVKEQFSCGNDFSPKVRKPYTITKQRERWTEEEHKKFLEALKLYGRAWRRIEEHVGSKTAVQIRSHAQKFFSKVVRESNSPAEPIEIPPPRPKRKPMHPYPRKMVHPINKESSVSEHQHRSLSPKLSISDNENQSPTSVLSVVCSDAVGSTDSNTPNGSLSPASCASGSHSPGDDGSRSANDEPSPKVPKLDLFPKEDVSEDGLNEETSTRSLKLFGRMVLVTECQGNEPIVRSKSCQADCNSVADGECKSPLYGGLPFPLGPFQKQETVKVILDSNGETQQKETQKAVSWTGSNSGSINNCEKVERNTETESCNNEDGHYPILELKLIERSASSNNCMKGFVPYKKRAGERDNIRLCL